MRTRHQSKKTWTPAVGMIDISNHRFSFSLANEKFGLRIFLAVITSLFLLLMISYQIRMKLSDWDSLPFPGLLWINTAVLILSCIGFQWAKIAANQNNITRVKITLLGGGLFTWLFLFGQMLVWKQLNNMGFYLQTNPANSFFYLMTALHGLHLLGGLIVWCKTSIQLFRDKKIGDLSLSIELLTIYWHFLLAVWLVMFTMMQLK